jgi:competence protein ComFC
MLLYHMAKKFRNFLLDLFFPKFCFNCQREGKYLCKDCQSILEISGFHQTLKTKEIDDLYFCADYKNPLIKKLIQKFKYYPFVKDLSKPLSSLIINHLQLLDFQPPFYYQKDFVLIPIPLEKRRLKWRGFNQAEEIAKHLSEFLKIPLINNILIKNRSTLPQANLSTEERKKNIINSFKCKNKIRKKVLLVDDVYTTGSTIKESARILKESGVKKIIAITIARAQPG